MRLKQELADRIADVLDADVGANDIEEPDPAHGDYAYPVMRVASERGEDPRGLAETVSDALADMAIVDDTAVAGPGYVNVTVDRDRFAAHVLDMLDTETMGVAQREGTVLLEFSSPNVAKPMHVGHFRNNALGDSLRRILSFVGYDVTAENWIGDWGTQYGKLIYAFKEYGSMEEFEDAPMEHMYDLYVKFHDELEDDPEMEEKGREWAEKVERGDDEAVRLWTMFRDASIEYHTQDYERMGVQFDRWTGESKYVDKAQDVLEDGIEQGVFTEDEDGSVSISFEDDDLPSIVVQKADGTTLYLTRDLATLRERKEDEGFDYNLYVVGAEQELHFQQLFRAADRLGYDTAGCEHISYGLLDLPEGSMSSRAGRIVRLSDLLDEAVDRAMDEVTEHDYAEDIAEAVGIGAVTYANLSVSRRKNITFDWDTILSFEGDTGPYLQYSSTRAKSIREKAAGEDAGIEAGEEPWADETHRVVTLLSRFPERVEAAADAREPAKIAAYLTQLCDAFNTFYHECPVLDADAPVRERRLAVVDAFIRAADTGLDLLGIEPLDEM